MRENPDGPVRSNPDEDLRRLERVAATGDQEAEERLEHARLRAGVTELWEYVTDHYGNYPFTTTDPESVWEELREVFTESDIGDLRWGIDRDGDEVYRDQHGEVVFVKLPARPNPDVDLRHLERRASAGDPHARAKLLRERLRLSGGARYYDPNVAAWFYRVPGETHWKLGNLGSEEFPIGYDGPYPFLEDVHLWLEDTTGGYSEEEYWTIQQRIAGEAVVAVVSVFHGVVPNLPWRSVDDWELFVVPINTDEDAPGNVYENAEAAVEAVEGVLNDMFPPRRQRRRS